jgi:hypothetical protein
MVLVMVALDGWAPKTSIPDTIRTADSTAT